jgi:hypothetical protein
MNKIKKYLLNLWYGLPFAVKGGEDAIFINPHCGVTGTHVSQEVSDQRVGRHLLKGEVTQEVEELRYRTYKVSNESEKYKYLGNGVAIKEEIPEVKSSEVNKIKFSQENNLICSSVLEELKRVDDYGVDKYRFEMMYDGTVKFKLEQFATSIDVLIDTRKRGESSIMETTLHFEKQANPYNAKSKPFINELAKIKDVNNEYEIKRNEILSSLLSISFTTYKANGEDNFVNYSFVEKNKFERFEETEHEYLLTFSWNGYIRLPLNLEDKYYSKEMDEKYKNKEKKDTPVEMVNTERKAYCSACGKEMSVYDADIMSANGQQVICKECLEKALNTK